MQLKGESRWDEAEMGILTSHGLGALRVADLVAAINTVPLYTQLNIPEESLPVSVTINHYLLLLMNISIFGLMLGPEKNFFWKVSFEHR